MFRNILVHIPSERPVRSVIDVAVSLAAARRSHLDAIAIGYESMSAAGMVVEGGGAAVAAVMGVEHDRALDRRTRRSPCSKSRPSSPRSRMAPGPWRRFPQRPKKPSDELARLYDLTVVLQPENSHSSYDNVIPQAVLFNSGGPMLMVPYIHKGPLDPRHVGIAWDGSRLAARALRDALPFLTAARGRHRDCRQRGSARRQRSKFGPDRRSSRPAQHQSAC